MQMCRDRKHTHTRTEIFTVNKEGGEGGRRKPRCDWLREQTCSPVPTGAGLGFGDRRRQAGGRKRRSGGATGAARHPLVQIYIYIALCAVGKMPVCY